MVHLGLLLLCVLCINTHTLTFKSGHDTGNYAGSGSDPKARRNAAIFRDWKNNDPGFFLTAGRFLTNAMWYYDGVSTWTVIQNSVGSEVVNVDGDFESGNRPPTSISHFGYMSSNTSGWMRGNYDAANSGKWYEFHFTLKQWRRARDDTGATANFGSSPGEFSADAQLHDQITHLPMYFKQDSNSILMHSFLVPAGATGGAYPSSGSASDLWEYSIDRNQYRWIAGPQIVDATGNKTKEGIFSPLNWKPGGGGLRWTLYDKELWYFWTYPVMWILDVSTVDSGAPEWKFHEISNCEWDTVNWGHGQFSHDEFNVTNCPMALGGNSMFRIGDSNYLGGGLYGYGNTAWHNSLFVYSTHSNRWKWVYPNDQVFKKNQWPVQESDILGSGGEAMGIESSNNNGFLWIGRGFSRTGGDAEHDLLFEFKMEVTCFDYNSTDERTCSGHGNCTAMDTCSCENGYTGDSCHIKIGLEFLSGHPTGGYFSGDATNPKGRRSNVVFYKENDNGFYLHSGHDGSGYTNDVWYYSLDPFEEMKWTKIRANTGSETVSSAGVFDADNEPPATSHQGYISTNESGWTFMEGWGDSSGYGRVYEFSFSLHEWRQVLDFSGSSMSVGSIGDFGATTFPAPASGLFHTYYIKERHSILLAFGRVVLNSGDYSVDGSYVNDIWEYSIPLNQFRFIKGSQASNAAGGKGSGPGLFHPNNRPPSGGAEPHWALEKKGLFYNYIGEQHSGKQEMWIFDVNLEEWKFLEFSNDDRGGMATKGVFAAENCPGPLMHQYGMRHAENYLFAMGGDAGTKYRNIYRYSVDSNQWMWETGGDSINDVDSLSDVDNDVIGGILEARPITLSGGFRSVFWQGWGMNNEGYFVLDYLWSFAPKMMCFDIYSDNETVCSGHGKCTDVDKCGTCDENYSGEFCNITKCDGVWNYEIGVCSGHGDCDVFEDCSCQENYFGEFCNVTKCFGEWSNETVCNDHGGCDEYDVCTCKSNYFGEFCNVTICFGELSNETVCNDHGECEFFDSCSCESNYFGEFCNVTKCFGDWSNDTVSVCNDHGDCHVFDICECSTNYYGAYCNITTCSSKFSNETDEVCNSHGKCTTFNTCDCISPYFGSECELLSDFFSLLSGTPTKGDRNGTYSCFEPNSNPGGRSRHGGAVFGSTGAEEMVVFGGFGFGEKSGELGHLNDLWRYSLHERRWCFVKGSKNVGVKENVIISENDFDVSNLPGARSSFGVFSTSFSLFIFGGSLGGNSYSLFSSSNNQTNELWELSIIEKPFNWRILQKNEELEQKPKVRSSVCMGKKYGLIGDVIGDLSSPVYLFGGGNSEFGLFSDIWVYDLMTNTFSQGISNQTNYTSTLKMDWNETEYYSNIPKKTYEEPSIVPAARFQHSCWVGEDDHFYIFGGTLRNKKSVNDVWMYNTTRKSWAWVFGDFEQEMNMNVVGEYFEFSDGNVPAPRSSAIFFLNQRGMGRGLLFFGGMNWNSGVSFADVWAYKEGLGQFKFVNGSVTGDVMGSGKVIASRFDGIGCAERDMNLLIFGGEK